MEEFSSNLHGVPFASAVKCRLYAPNIVPCASMYILYASDFVPPTGRIVPHAKSSLHIHNVRLLLKKKQKSGMSRKALFVRGWSLRNGGGVLA